MLTAPQRLRTELGRVLGNGLGRGWSKGLLNWGGGEWSRDGDYFWEGDNALSLGPYLVEDRMDKGLQSRWCDALEAQKA